MNNNSDDKSKKQELESAFKKLKFNEEWIKKNADINMINDCMIIAETLVCFKISASQLRNIYGELQRIKMKRTKKSNVKTDLILLKPKIYYNSSRIQDKKTKEIFNKFIQEHFEKAIDIVINNYDNDQIFNNFHNYLEAILAYHKYYGGK